MKKAGLEAVWGANPRDGPRRTRPDPLSSRRECRRRGRLLHARNVKTFATSPSGAPGRPPVTPRDVISSPLFSALASTYRRVSPLAQGAGWPGSCLNVGHVGAFRDIWRARPVTRTWNSARRRDERPRVDGGLAWCVRRAEAREFATAARPFPDRAIPFRNYVAVLAVTELQGPARPVREPSLSSKAGHTALKNRTHCVEKYDELANRSCVYRGVAVLVWGGTAAMEGNADSPVGCFPTGSGFRRREWRCFPPLIGGSPPRKRCYRERTECGRRVEDDHANAA